jgi:hypothetical protein
MSHIATTRRPAVVTALALLLASLGLAACGGSSSSTTTTAKSASASTTTPGGTATPGSSTTPGSGTRPPGPTPQGTARFKALRECLQKNGVTLPQRTPGQRPGQGGLLGAGRGSQLPKGMTRAQYEAVIKKCGGGAFRNPGFRARRFKSPATKQALTKFADCMRKNGVNVPEPNTSGNGPIFDTKGIDTASAQFKSAEAKCAVELRGAFHPGAAGSPSTGAPGAG